MTRPKGALPGEVMKYGSKPRLPYVSEATLLVIDMQEYFHTIAEPILPGIKRWIATCRSAGVPIIYTWHLDDPDHPTILKEEWWEGGEIVEGSKESELMPEVGHSARDPLIKKGSYSGFYKTELDTILRRRGVKEVLVTGVMTNLCCETTAREAFVRGYRVFFSTDATATTNQELHTCTLKNMAYGFAYLLEADMLMEAFGK